MAAGVAFEGALYLIARLREEGGEVKAGKGGDPSTATIAEELAAVMREEANAGHCELLEVQYGSSTEEKTSDWMDTSEWMNIDSVVALWTPREAREAELLGEAMTATAAAIKDHLDELPGLDELLVAAYMESWLPAAPVEDGRVGESGGGGGGGGKAVDFQPAHAIRTCGNKSQRSAAVHAMTLFSFFSEGPPPMRSPSLARSWLTIAARGGDHSAFFLLYHLISPYRDGANEWVDEGAMVGAAIPTGGAKGGAKEEARGSAGGAPQVEADKEAFHWLMCGAVWERDHTADVEFGLGGSGPTRCMYLLGRCYEQGQGVRKSMKRAMGWFARAAARGNQRGLMNITVRLGMVANEQKAQESGRPWLRGAFVAISHKWAWAAARRLGPQGIEMALGGWMNGGGRAQPAQLDAWVAEAEASEPGTDGMWEVEGLDEEWDEEREEDGGGSWGGRVGGGKENSGAAGGGRKKKRGGKKKKGGRR